MTRQAEPIVIPAFPDLSFEIGLWNQGILAIGGADEAGRGAWAGPVAASAVIFPRDCDLGSQLEGVRDSKMMTAHQREAWAGRIREKASAWGVGMAGSQEIDQMGILPATRLAFQRAIEQLCVVPQHLLLDFIRLPEVLIPQTSLVKGDARSLTIAAASILAKTSRDAWMREIDRQYPQYGFIQHKGYGTKQHFQALLKWGPCPIHRFSFRPVQECENSGR